MDKNKRRKQNLQEDFKRALLAGKKEEAEAVNYLISLLQRQAERSPEGKLTPEQEVGILQKELKKKREARKLYSQGGRRDLAEKEEKEIKLLQGYLPKAMSEEEIAKLVAAQVVGETDFGKAMSKVMARVKGKADGAVVARLVRERLGKQT